jgi:hypothetical protein
MKQTRIQSPKYWNVAGSRKLNGLKINAASGIESVKAIELEISSPRFGFNPSGHCSIEVWRKNSQPI